VRKIAKEKKKEKTKKKEKRKKREEEETFPRQNESTLFSSEKVDIA
jgi:hypothetical protein